MEEAIKIKEWINYYSDVAILVSKANTETLEAGKALLLSLRKLNKNATLAEIEDCPQTEKISKPSNNPPQADFLISIKEGGSKLSQLFYEKTSAGLNLFLKTDGKELKKEDIILKPLKQEQLLITIGIDCYEKVPANLKEKSNFILNIDNKTNNQWFGDINLIEYDKPIEEISFRVIKVLGEMLFEKESSFNFFSPVVVSLFKKAFLNLSFNKKSNILIAKLSHLDFLESKAQITDIKFILEKLTSELFSFQNFLLLWEQNSSPLAVRGVFYSKQNQENIEKIAKVFTAEQKNNSLIFKTKETNLEKAELQIINILS
ncbi:MAG: hypothetical protein PHY72_03035 [Candidatus Pacebacteria bacterium]|nr:hypothetical protein [Candidatus Paceibacterota bacterium]